MRANIISINIKRGPQFPAVPFFNSAVSSNQVAAAVIYRPDVVAAVIYIPIACPRRRHRRSVCKRYAAPVATVEHIAAYALDAVRNGNGCKRRARKRVIFQCCDAGIAARARPHGRKSPYSGIAS